MSDISKRDSKSTTTLESIFIKLRPRLGLEKKITGIRTQKNNFTETQSGTGIKKVSPTVVYCWSKSNDDSHIKSSNFLLCRNLNNIWEVKLIVFLLANIYVTCVSRSSTLYLLKESRLELWLVAFQDTGVFPNPMDFRYHTVERLRHYEKLDSHISTQRKIPRYK